MEALIESTVQSYGPYAVFMLLMLTGIGVPLGEDLIVIPAGAFVGRGDMGFWATFLATWAGVTLSDFMWYFWCYRYGTRLLHKRAFKRLVHPRRMLEAKHQFDRRGAWVVVMARFVPGSRTTAITVAGILHMPFWKFALATACSVMVTAPIQIGIGALTVRVMGVRDTADLMQLILGFMIVAAAGMVVLATWRKHKASRRHAPRARARWLKLFRGQSPRATEPEQTNPETTSQS